MAMDMSTANKEGTAETHIICLQRLQFLEGLRNRLLKAREIPPVKCKPQKQDNEE